MLRVSCDAEVSDDEDIDNSNDPNDDSFIDDRINPTVNTQGDDVRSDMMAIYRYDIFLYMFLSVKFSCI